MKVKRNTKVQFNSGGVQSVHGIEVEIQKNESWKVVVVLANGDRYSMNALRRLCRAGYVKIWNVV